MTVPQFIILKPCLMVQTNHNFVGRKCLAQVQHRINLILQNAVLNFVFKKIIAFYPVQNGGFFK